MSVCLCSPSLFLLYAIISKHSRPQEHNASVTPALFQEANALKGLLKQTLGWDYDMTLLPTQTGVGESCGQQAAGDEEEDGPVVVHDPTDLIAF